MAADEMDLNSNEFDEVVQAGQDAAGEQQIPEATETAAEPLVNPLFAEAKAAGLDFGEDIQDSDGLARYLLKQLSEEKQYADYGRSALSQAPVQPANQPANEQSAADDEQPFDEHEFFSEAWNVPALSPGAQWALKVGAVTTDERGMIVAAEGPPGQAALPYLQELNNYQQVRAKLNESFAENPVQFTWEKQRPLVERLVEQKVRELTGQAFQGQEQQAYVDKFRAEHASWLYNAAGTAFTPQGAKFAELVNRYSDKLGLQEATALALQIMPPPAKEGGDPLGNSPPGNTVAKPAPAAQIKEERQRDEQGRFSPAGKPAPAAPKKPDTFMEKAKQRAMASHASIGSTPENTVVANEGDLDSMWDNAWRAHATAN